MAGRPAATVTVMPRRRRFRYRLDPRAVHIDRVALPLRTKPACRGSGRPGAERLKRRDEKLARGTADLTVKTVMVALYTLWHRLRQPEDHRPDASRFLAEHEHLLQAPSMPAFVVGLLSRRMPDWSVEDWEALAATRQTERARRRQLELPAGLDAALQVIAADQLFQAGQPDEARALARLAVEELPGHSVLLTWEAGVADGERSELDITSLVLGVNTKSAEDPA